MLPPSRSRASLRWLAYLWGSQRPLLPTLPPLSHQAEGMGCMLGVTPSCPLLPARRAGIVAVAVAPRYHQSTWPRCYPLAMREFGVDACGVASWLIPHVPHLQSRVGCGRLACGLPQRRSTAVSSPACECRQGRVSCLLLGKPEHCSVSLPTPLD
ncbi:LOW QUALITY PROTEIN: hypothetical protein CVT26_013322 [Gymnopilus dilepis]|uniref:Uncharacterized protein n=1 Tax=Gymnopilus dilepis TaxID=231916 RepID=A0A409YF53_9AGAR|nr:LOW QUALITY PROTEIN: hypothetical protein CVT26_013322 [Gymnopilus dilepis]